MNRSDFLNHEWQSYLPMPKHSLVYGAVQEITRESSFVALKINEQIFRLDLSSQKKRDLQFCDLNDLVVIDHEKQLSLLAPSLAKPIANFNLARQKKWNTFIKKVRHFFEDQNFIEVQTPSLVVCPGPEPTLEVFATELQWGSRRKKLFLPTSPELSLKKYLAHAVREQAELKIFEIAKVFRNGEITERHHPEFFMLEWYRSFQGLEVIVDDLTQLIGSLSGRADLNVQRKSLRELFLEILDFPLTPATTADDLKNLCKKIGLETRSIDQFDDLFNLVFIEKIEFQWPKEELFFLEKYPPSQAALARVDKDGWAERFELYWQGFELANAFHELNDPVIQGERMAHDLELKKVYGRQEIFADDQFIQSLEYGMPPTSGVALGLERLFMALEDIKNIALLKFPIDMTSN